MNLLHGRGTWLEFLRALCLRGSLDVLFAGVDGREVSQDDGVWVRVMPERAGEGVGHGVGEEAWEIGCKLRKEERSTTLKRSSMQNSSESGSVFADNGRDMMLGSGHEVHCAPFYTSAPPHSERRPPINRTPRRYHGVTLQSKV